MNLHDILLLSAGAAAGGLVNGMAGFGTALFSLGFLLQIMPPTEAVSVVVILSISSGIQGLFVVRHAIAANPARLARFVLPALLGVPAGTAILAVIRPGTLRITIAMVLIGYGIFFLLGRSMPRMKGSRPMADCLVGLCGGVLGGAASLSGVLPTIWCAMHAWTKAEQRAVMQPFNIAVLATTALVLALRGSYSAHVLTEIAVALPVALLAAQAGLAIYHRLTDQQFRALLVAVMGIAGVVLLAREALAF